jgi:hypothetical protein
MTNHYKSTTVELRDGDKDELLYIFEVATVPRVGEYVSFVSHNGHTYFGKIESVYWHYEARSIRFAIAIVTITEVEYSVTKEPQL